MNDIAAGYLGLARHDFATARVHGLAAHESDPFDSNALAILIDAEIELGNYTAEYGLKGGSQINFVTKRGGQNFHGTAYWYKRH